MTEDCIHQRVKEIYDAYERNGHTKDYTIRLTPINGSCDIHVELVRATKIKEKLIRERMIKGEDDLKFIEEER